MKKNRMMRLASGLLVAVLLTTSVISGTFAKYTNSASSQDSARVAKWGVNLVVAGDKLFSNQYEDTANGVSVKSIDEQKVVAPGTSEEESTILTFKVTGQPEVKTDLDFTFDNVKDIYLKAGTYTDFTEVTGYDNNSNPIYGKSFTLDYDYYPVVYTLKNDKGDALKTGRLIDIEKYMESDAFSKVYDATTKLDTVYGGENGVYTLEWKWNYNGPSTLYYNEDQTNVFDATVVDKADTLLGNLMVDPSLVDNSEKVYNLDIVYELTITATQID